MKEISAEWLPILGDDTLGESVQIPDWFSKDTYCIHYLFGEPINLLTDHIIQNLQQKSIGIKWNTG
jgi:hypothetical protein